MAQLILTIIVGAIPVVAIGAITWHDMKNWK